MSRTIREAKSVDMPEIMQVMEVAKKIVADQFFSKVT